MTPAAPKQTPPAAVGAGAAKVITVAFEPSRNRGDYAIDTKRHPVQVGNWVVVEGVRGLSLGRVLVGPHKPTGKGRGRLRKVVRRAKPSDVEIQRQAEAMEDHYFRVALAHVRTTEAPLRLLRAAADGLGKRVTFFFAAKQREECRDLGAALSRELGLHVELRQLGSRDEAKILGGLGRCGRELCCASHLHEYPRSSIKMAKAQNVALSDDKTNGVCGRTLCCLAYEYDFYEDFRQWLPRLGKRAKTVDGLEGKVIGLDVLRLSFTLLEPGGPRHVLPAVAWERNLGKVVPEAEVGPAACGPSETAPVVALRGSRSAAGRGSTPPTPNPADTSSDHRGEQAGDPKAAGSSARRQRRRRNRRQGAKPKTGPKKDPK